MPFRKRIVIGKKTIITAAAVIAGFVIAPVGVHAVQNIFAGFGQVTDIQFGGANIDQVVYQGETIWERNRTPTMQTLAGCPTDRTIVLDARDDATYWVRRIGDLCWMETNLAYAGGGNNTYGDVTPAITESNSNSSASYTTAIRTTPSGSNRTTGTTDPSTSTSGKGQYGYLYNWCAALNGQSAACQNSATTQPNQGVNGGTSSTLYNICPLGWRLPTGGSGGEFESLASSLSATNNAAGSTNLRTNGLFMYSGTWGGGWYGQDYYGYYWSSTAYPSDAYDAYYLNFNGTAVYPADYNAKDYGFAVRCVKDAPTPALQTITAANCPSARTMARDARDDHTYLVRRIGDLCWMETNLAYGGGGTNLYGDVISDLTLGTSGVNIADGQACYGEYYEMDEFGAKCYWIPSGSNVTSGSTAPSTSTDGTGQFGYLYSWCTAMNGQIGACSISTGNPQPDQSINGGTAATQYNICPTGWRLPTDGELLALNSAINGGSTTSSSGLLSNGLFMYGGGWYRGSKVSAGRGSYWTSVQNSSSRARYLDFSSTSLAISTVGDKGSGNAVRCVAP